MMPPVAAPIPAPVSVDASTPPTMIGPTPGTSSEPSSPMSPPTSPPLSAPTAAPSASLAPVDSSKSPCSLPILQRDADLVVRNPAALRSRMAASASRLPANNPTTVRPVVSWSAGTSCSRQYVMADLLRVCESNANRVAKVGLRRAHGVSVPHSRPVLQCNCSQVRSLP